MKRWSRALFVLGGGVFCLAVFSLYRLLELDRDEATPPGGQAEQDLSRLQLKIDRLERLLGENNRLVATLRDSLLRQRLQHYLEGSWKKREGGGGSNRSTAFMEMPGCRLAEKMEEEGGVQLLDVYKLLAFDNPDGGAWKQGFDIHYQGDEWAEQELEVIVVPHSHNDPGWLKTFDDYYRDQTRHILNNMVIKLSEDSRRKMIWSEVSFFAKWWNDIDEQKRSIVKRLVGAGQLELVSGGWVMPDEANTHYYSLLDQLIEGQQWLQRHLGVKPCSGWAVDPFGHSPTMAYLLKGAGLSAMLIQRVHYAIKKHFAQQQTLEFLWRQSWDPSPRSDILCHMMPFYSYDVPHTCGPNPAICCQFDFHRLRGGRVSCPWRIPPQPITEQNIQERALLLLDQYRQKSRLFLSPVLLVPLGDDFRYVDAGEWDAQFINYQKLFDYYDAHPDLRVKVAMARFGTLSDYFLSLRRRLGATRLPTLRGDFFTYADRDDHYWSGYFTSRAFYKRAERRLQSMLRATELLFSLALAEAGRHHGKEATTIVFPASDGFRRLAEARRSLALFQHHDGVTGTSRDHVVTDYGTRLFRSMLSLSSVLQSSTHWLLLMDKNHFHHDEAMHLFTVDDIQVAEDTLPAKTILQIGAKPRPLVVYNPTEQPQSTVVSIVVDSPDVRVVIAETGQPVMVQLSAVWEEPTKASTQAFQLSFLADLPPLSLLVYHVTASSSSSAPHAEYTFLRQDLSEPPTVQAKHFRVSWPRGEEANAPLTLQNKYVQIWSSTRSGLLQNLRLHSGVERRMELQFLWYGTRGGANRDKSGAYLFLPDGQAQPYSPSQPPLVRVTRGPLFSEITSFYQHFTHTARLYHVEGHAGSSVELLNTVDIRSEVNHELAMRIDSNIASGNRLYSDLNGFQMQQRRRLAKLPLQGNFYPMSSSAFLQEQKARLTLLSAQSQGVASLSPGSLEVILERRLNQDDNRGLGQGVTDNKVTASTFRLLLEERTGGGGGGGRAREGNEGGGATKDMEAVSHLSLLAHVSALALCQPPIILVASGDKPLPRLRPFLPLRASLPCDLHLLNLRSLEGQEAGSPSQEALLLLHRKGYDCSMPPIPSLQCTWSANEEFDLDDFFSSSSSLRFLAVQPGSLTLTSPSDSDDQLESMQQQQQQGHVVRVRPMEINAFQVKIG